jgi:photosystem II stability/assembly factor-like uncharacterized protein
MKKLAFIILMFFIVHFISHAQWQVLNEGKQPAFGPIDFISDEVGWALRGGWDYFHLSQPNLLLKTYDFGRTWSEIDISEFDGTYIREIEFVSDSIGWLLAGDEPTKLSYTADGGNSWELLYESTKLEHICVTEENIVFVVKDDREVLKITDNEVFEILPNISITNFSVGMWFKDPYVGFVTDSENSADGDNYLYATIDGGNTWEKRSVQFTWMANIQFVSDSLTYFMGYFMGNFRLYKSHDALQTWSMVSQPDLDIASYQIVSPDSIYLITGQDIRLSVDAGATSEVIEGLSPGWEPDWSTTIYFNSMGEMYIPMGTCLMRLGDGGCRTGRMDYRSEDKGRNWTLWELSYPFSEVQFIDENKGFVVGGGESYSSDHGEIFVTNDGGNSWEVSLNYHSPFRSVQFFNERTGYVLIEPRGLDPIMFKTTNGGGSWEGIYINDLDYYGSGISMYFTDELTGWWVHNPNDTTKIWGTKDGGQTWTNAWKSTTRSYAQTTSIHFSGSVGWVVGLDGRIIKYDDEVWQEITSPTTRRFDKVYFYDAENGWIISEYDSDYESDRMIFRTEDGGVTWDSSEIDFKINDLFFEDSKTGWAVGKDPTDVWPASGVILQTVDGGMSWTLAKDQINGELRDLNFKDGYLWAAGNNGLVIKTTEKIVGIEETTSEITDRTNMLVQNYPNPFSGITTIEYHLPVNANVDLSIYNSLGQKVTSLVSAEQPSGYYQVEWDASAFPSGIYVLHLSDGKYIVQKKIIKK